MRETRLLMGMPITVEICGAIDSTIIEAVFDYFRQVDRRFSTYRSDSEISAINRGEVSIAEWSSEMAEVLALAERTKSETGGYFDIRRPDGSLDPSGIVKGWAIRNAARIVERACVADFFIDAGGDIQSCGRNAAGLDWSVGIRNPFNLAEIIKVVYPRGRGIATSGTYVRGEHIYNPLGLGASARKVPAVFGQADAQDQASARKVPAVFGQADVQDQASARKAWGRCSTDIVSLTVIAEDVFEADRFATAAFAMGRDGILFLEETPGLEGYMVDSQGRATPTSGFGAFCEK